MPGGNQIRFGIGFDVNKAGLNELKQSLQQIQKMTSQDALKSGNFNNLKEANQQLSKAKKLASEVELALKKAFNSSLDSFNVTKLHQELNKLNLTEIGNSFSQLGVQGKVAFNSLAAEALKMNVQIKQSYTMLDKMKETMANTVKWTIASSAVSAFTGSISSAFNYVKALDASLTDIRIVTGQSREEMAQFAVQANAAAQALGRQTKEYTNAALTFYQQGLGEAEVQARTEATLKAQNVTGAGTEMADYLTAVWNGFKVSAENTERYVDKLAAVADSSASNMSELAIAMSKVASTANNMGVDMDQLTAQISTIIATTRQAPETVGNALKTIYARINDIKSGSDEAEISLGNYTGRMQKLGISVLDANGRLRDTGDVMEEIGAKWGTMTREQQIYLAQTMAGQRQMNNLIALFDNWGKYSEMLNVSLNAQGALNEKNARYMDSIAAHYKQLQASIEGMQDAMIAEDSIIFVYDLGRKIVNIFTNMIHSAGGFFGVLSGAGILLSEIFEKHLVNGLTTFIQNTRTAKEQLEDITQDSLFLKSLEDSLAGRGIKLNTAEINESIASLKRLRDEVQAYYQVMSTEDKVKYNTFLDQQNDINAMTLTLKENLDKARNYANEYRKVLQEFDFGYEDQIGALYTQNTNDGSLEITKNKEDIEATVDTLINLQAHLGDTSKEFTKFQESFKQDHGDILKIYTERARLSTRLVQLTSEEGEEYEYLSERIRQLTEELEANPEAFELLNSKLQEFNKLAEQGVFGNNSAQVQDILGKIETGSISASAGLNQLSQILGMTEEEIADLVYQTQFAERSFQNLKLKIEEAGSSWAQFKTLLSDKAMAQGVASIGQSVTQLTFVLSSLSGLFNTIKQIQKGQISGFEAFNRIATSGVMIISGAIGVYDKFTKGIKLMAPALLASASAKGKDAVAGVAATATNLTLGQSFKVVAASALEAIAAIAPYVVAIGVIAAIVIGIATALNEKAHAEERAAEAAAKHAEQMKQGYEDAKQSFEALKSEIEDYKDARAAIDNLVVGTQEWSDALQDVYDKVLALMEAYPELAQYVTYDENGVPTISQEGIDTMYQLKREEVQAAQQRSIIAQRDKLEADLNLIYANAAKEAGSTSKAIKELYTELASNAAMYTDFIAAQGTGDFDSFIDTYGSDLGVAAEKAAQAIIENNINIKESIATVKTNTAAIDAQTRAFTDSVYSGNLNYQNYEYKNAISQVIDRTFSKARDRAQKEIAEAYNPDLWQTGTGVSGLAAYRRDMEEVYKEYAALVGGTYDGFGGIFGLDTDTAKIDGEEVSYEEAAQALSEEKARKLVSNLSESILSDIQAITQTAYEVGGNAAASAISNLIGSRDFTPLKFLNEETIEKAKEALSTISYNQAQELLNSEIFTTEMYKGSNQKETGNLINKSDLRTAAEAYQQAVLETLQDPELVSDDILDIYGIKREDLKNFGNRDLVNDVSLDNITQIGNLLEQAEKISPEATNLIKQVFSEFVDPKQYTNFLKVLGEIDKDTSVEKFKEMLEEAGVVSDDVTGEIDEFDDSLLLLLNLFTGEGNIGDAVLASAEAIKKAKDIVSDIHYGDEISQEDFDALQRLGIENLETFFTMTLDGTYRLIGNSEKLRDTINQMQFDNFEDRVEEARENLALLNGFSGKSKREDTGESWYRAQNIWGDTEAHLNEVLPYIESFSANQIDNENDPLYKKIDAILQVLIAGGGTSNLSVDQLKGYRTKLEHGEFGDMEREELNNAISIFGTIGDHVEQLTAQLKTMEGTLGLKDLDSDVNVEEFERMADYLAEYGGEIYNISEDIKGNYDAAKMIAEEFLRADAAAESVDKNIEKWTRSLADPQHNMEDYLESLEELDNAYKDLLNLSNDIELSEEFKSSAENLQLMREALNGNIASYDQLVENAQKDILSKSIQDNETGVEIPVEINKEQLLESVFSDIMSLTDEAQQYFDENGIEIGADIQDAPFISKLEGIINAAGMTAEDATALLSTMGIDATVVEGKPTEAASEYVAQAWTGPEYRTQKIPFGGPIGGGFLVVPELVNEGTWKPVEAKGTEKSPRPFALQITNAKRGTGSGGNINHKKLGGNSGGRKKSGGGGGGGSKKKEPTKPFKSKIDPYHDVNIKIGNVKEGLDKLGKDRDKLIGKAAIDNLRKQVDLMEQEKELLREKAEIAKSELQRQGQELANLGAIFDANGDIANYSQLLLDKQNQINQAIEYGNTLQGDQRDAYDKYIKDLEQEYKDLETAIKDYDSTQQLLDDLELDYADIINEQIEKAIEAFDLEINLHLDLKDAQKEFNEFRKKIIDQIQDDEFGRLAEATARNYQNYYNVGADGNVGGIIPELRQHVQQIYNELQVMTNGGFSQIYGDNLAAAAEDLKKYNDELMKNLEEAQDVIDETHQNFLDAIDSLSDAFDKQQEAFDKIDTFLEHDIELIQLVRGEEDYAALEGLYQQRVVNDQKTLEALRRQQEEWRQQLDQYEEGTDEWEKAMENWQESFAALNEAMINSVKNLQTQWENSMNRILKDLGNSVYGGDQARALEEWENLNWHSDRYLDNLARANGLLNLQAEFTKAINATQDPKRQKELADLEQKQLDTLSQKEHIREIDLKLAQQQLTVMQAQMALEDAQQSKTKMRLRRDSQGNYTYQYVADEDNIAEKTQEYMNALEEYRNMAKEALRDVQDEMNDTYLEWVDKVREAFEHFGSDTEAFKNRIETLQEDYFGEHGKMTLLAQEANDRQQDSYIANIAAATEMYDVIGETAMQKLLGPGGDSIISMVQQLISDNGGEIPSLLSHFMVDTYEPFIESLDQKTHDQLFSTDGIFPEWGAAISGLAKDYVTGFVPDVVEAMNLLLQSHQEYIYGLGIIQEAAGRTFGQVAAGLDADTGYSYSLITATDELVEAQKAQVEQANAVYDALKRNEEAFKDQTKAAIDAANAMFLYWLTLNGQTTSSLPYSVEGYTGVRSNPSSTKASPNNYSSSGSGGGSGSGGSSNNSASGSPGYTSSGSSGKYDWRGIPWEYSPDNPNRKKSASFASGGYTGSWGDNGRIAVLHQKELVLNEDDTKNVLKAVNITRAITSGVSSMAAAALSNLSGGRGYSALESTTDSILQNVVINADFPAVQDAAQIKQAFNELVNIASQRASKNRRAY